MRKFTLLFSLFIFSFSLCEGQSWMWCAGGYGAILGSGDSSPVATDKYGNVYITGNSQGDTLIVNNDTIKHAYGNPYLIKYNSLGGVLWIRIIGGNSGSSFASYIATDKAGDIYVVGNFQRTFVAGTDTLACYIGTDAFIVKYDANGNAIWAKQSQALTSESATYPTSVTTDKFGNVYMTGGFRDTVSFGRDTLKIGFENIYNTNSDAFLMKYDSNGNIFWAKQSKISSVSNTGGKAQSVATDKYGNAYITGFFYDTLSFGSNSLNSTNSSYKVFLVKYSPSGNVLWAIANSGGPCQGYSVIIDGVDNSYITGGFQDTIMFNNQILYALRTTNAFVAKFDTNGNVIWAKKSSSGWVGTGLASDEYYDIYFVGSNFQNKHTDTFKFGGLSLYADTIALTASYIMKLDTSGKAVCGSIVDNLNQESINGVASDLTGNYVYTASVFDSLLFCGPDTIRAIGPIFNGFVGRWLPCNLFANEETSTLQKSSLSLFPNPSTGKFSIVLSHAVRQLADQASQTMIEIYNVLGEKVNIEILKQVQGDYEIDLSSRPSGIYFYRVISDDGNVLGSGKFIIQK